MMQQKVAPMALPLMTTHVPPHAQIAKFTDTFDIDQAGHRLYYGDNWTQGLEVFDISTPTAKYVTTIRPVGNSFGVRVAKNVNKVYVGAANSKMAVVDIDPNSKTFQTVVATLDSGGKGAVDLIGYDPDHKKIYAANRGDAFTTVYDATTDKPIARIDDTKSIEDPVYNPNDGCVYITANATSILYQIDGKTDKLVHTFNLGNDQRPNGLALNAKANQGLMVSSNRDKPQHMLWDFKTQKIVETITDVGSGDGGCYVPKLDRYLTGSSGHNPGPAVGIISGKGQLLGIVPTGRTGSWVGYDETNNIVYVPTVQEGRAALTGFVMPKL